MDSGDATMHLVYKGSVTNMYLIRYCLSFCCEEIKDLL